MDLNQPCYDSILHIDKKLEELQKEVENMEKEYGFNEKHTNLTAHTNMNKTKNSTTKTQISNKTNIRYQNLKNIKAEEKNAELKKTKINPKISQKWIDIFRAKPDNNYFLEKNKVNSFPIDKENLRPNFNFSCEDNFIHEYMKGYALKIMKNEE